MQVVDAADVVEHGGDGDAVGSIPVVAVVVAAIAVVVVAVVRHCSVDVETLAEHFHGEFRVVGALAVEVKDSHAIEGGRQVHGTGAGGQGRYEREGVFVVRGSFLVVSQPVVAIAQTVEGLDDEKGNAATVFAVAVVAISIGIVGVVAECNGALKPRNGVLV